MAQTVASVAAGIGSDPGEWRAFAGAWSSAANIYDYASSASALWTSGLDQSSWTIVKTAAETAAKDPDEARALKTVLLAFTTITSPSHNSDQWAALSSESLELLNALDPGAFQELMSLVIELNRGITTDAGEWNLYAAICADAVISGIGTYIERCVAELWTDGLDQRSWAAVLGAAHKASSANSAELAVAQVRLGFLQVCNPSHNESQWGALQNAALPLFGDDSSVVFNGTDTRQRRLMVDPDAILEEMAESYLIKRDGFPARYEEVFNQKRCHVEYFMRLNTDANKDAYFIVTHSQDAGGYVGLAKVPAQNIGVGSNDNQISVAEPDFAGDMVWWDLLDGNHPGGCNHPGNGGAIGSTVVLVGQDWTKDFPVYGHAVTPVGHGSKVLFYDFSNTLQNGVLPAMSTPGQPSDAYLGCLTTVELNLAPGDDGEVSSVVVEQGPDGLFYLIAGNANQTVVWSSPTLKADIKTWSQVPISYASSLNDGSSMLAWAVFNGSPQALYWVTSREYGMDFHPLQYAVVDGVVVGLRMDGSAPFKTTQSSQFGDGDWVEDNGSLYVGSGGGLALHGAYKSVNDEKGPSSGNEVPCIQVRTWY